MPMLTKSKQVEHYLRNAIISRRWVGGEAMPSERELLEELGVSRTTLRDALNVLASDGLITRKHRSGTFVADLPKLACIATLARDVELSSPVSYWYRPLVEHAQKRIIGSGYRAVLSVGHGKTLDEFMSSINLFDESIIKDTLGVLTTIDIGKLENRLAEAGIYSVAISPGVPIGKYSVVLDYEQMAKLGIAALKARGHNDYAVMSITSKQKPMFGYSERHLVARDQVLRNTVDNHDERLVLIDHSLDYSNAYDAFKQWWSQPDRPNAMFFWDDALFDVASRAILELGIKVPDELAIITHAPAGRSFHFPVPVTRVQWDVNEIVDIAWDMLRRLIGGQVVNEPVIYVPPTVQEGESL